MRLIDADALKEKKVYSHERHEKIVPVAEIDWLPTIDAIPVEWLEAKKTKLESNYWIGPRTAAKAIEILIRKWKEEQEAR